MEFKCITCNKKYKSYQSLWNHTHKFHKNNKTNVYNNFDTNIQSINKTDLQPIEKSICEFCNKKLSNRQSRWRHEKTCDKNQSTINNKQNIIIANLTNEIERLKSDFKIILNSSLQLAQAEPNETIVQTNQTNQTKKSIPIIVKRLVWNKYIGEDIGKSKCYCCKLSYITQLSFHCGHVVAEKNGGDINVDNLRPICQSCNSSMGINNMDSYITKYSLHKSNNDIEV
jgi:hypothetical protein